MVAEKSPKRWMNREKNQEQKQKKNQRKVKIQRVKKLNLSGKSAALIGDFNNWNPNADVMAKKFNQWLELNCKTKNLELMEESDGEGRISQTRLKVQDVFAMTDSSTRILTQWNRNNQPVGDSSSLLAGFLGQVASNFGNFPANFVVNDDKHKQYILRSLGNKWKDKRCRLFDKYHNWELSVEENIQNHPPHIPQDHWAIFVRYRRNAKAMDIANKNAANRAKLVIPHILGSKTLARKRDELETIHGREFSRAEMYQLSHKKPDGTFVNEEARELHEKLQEQMQNCSENEAFMRVCGKEHPGYVRGMGLGVSPSQIVGSSSGATSSTTSIESNERMEQMQAEIESLKAQVAEIDSLKAQVAETPDLESPINKRSSEGSHMPQGGNSPATI
ncbi:hypothetical protein Fmac_008074 [Flemingia macrophylla]|uniref:Transposase n=1 Tax=Flemingia macrophylla TaxID=520843 RepID=A0ABD1MWG0_9FABA